MRKTIQRNKVFQDGVQGMEEVGKKLVNEEIEDQQKKDLASISRKAGPVDENLKYGRRNKTANIFNKAQ